jgi:hypothetical protein
MEDVDAMVEAIYEKRRYYPPSNRIWEDWSYVEPTRTRPSGVTHAVHTKNIIRDLLERGHTVKYGWCGTAIRGFHENWVFYK